jgi:hypothetical protein
VILPVLTRSRRTRNSPVSVVAPGSALAVDGRDGTDAQTRVKLVEDHLAWRQRLDSMLDLIGPGYARCSACATRGPRCWSWNDTETHVCCADSVRTGSPLSCAGQVAGTGTRPTTDHGMCSEDDDV